MLVATLDVSTGAVVVVPDKKFFIFDKPSIAVVIGEVVVWSTPVLVGEIITVPDGVVVTAPVVIGGVVVVAELPAAAAAAIAAAAVALAAVSAAASAAASAAVVVNVA